MPTIRPFRAVRPTNDKVHLVASRSYVTYDDDQMRDKLRNNPYSFIQIIHPDFDSDTPTEPGSRERFERVHERYRAFLNDGIFARDSSPCYYVYRQSSASIDSIGIIAAAMAGDYRSGLIKIHEQTLSVREALFADYLEITGFNAEPILITHDDDDELNGWLAGVSGRQPEVHFTTADEITHRLWVINQPEDLEFVSAAYDRMQALYIADGHHRSASSVLLADRLQRTDERDPMNHFMVYLIPASRLLIHGYHRIVKRMSVTPEELLRRIATVEGVLVSESPRDARIPAMRHIDLYLAGTRHRVKLPDDVPAHCPDADWLTTNILAPLLGITDLRNDTRIAFEPETTGVDVLLAAVDRGEADAIFLLHPVPFEQLKEVADRSATMPPKSTWIEPKLRSGLVVYDLTYPDTLHPSP